LYPDFLNTLPGEWQVRPVSEACTFTAKPRSLDLGDYEQLAFVPMDLIPTGRLHFSSFILKRPAEIASGTYFEEGDLLVSKITPCFENGKQGIAQAIPNGFGIATTEVIPLKPRDGLTHLPFIAYYLLHHEVRHLIAAAMEGATGRQRLPKDLLAQWPVPIPPIDEQRAIARVLETIQAAAHVEAAICDKLAALKSATMAKLFREGLRGEPLKQTEIGEIPESWDVVRLGDIALIERGKFAHRPRNDPRFYGGTIPFIQTGDVARARGRLRSYTQTLNDRGLSVSRVFPQGTIVITIAANIGDTAILDIDAAFPDSLIGITPTSAADTEYLEFFLRTQKDEMNRLAPKGTQKNINIEFLRPWRIALPSSLDEQLQIAYVLRTIEQRELISRTSASKLNELFSSLLRQLMTGAVRVKDLDLAEVSHA
jgi:type I restriction enzyme S subunit